MPKTIRHCDISRAALLINRQFAAVIQSKKELSDLTVVSGSRWLGEMSNEELAELFTLTREGLN